MAGIDEVCLSEIHQRKPHMMQLTQHDIECLYEAREMIAKDISRHYTIQQIATDVGLSPTKLKKGFKQYFEMPVFEYLETERMERTKMLMRDTDKPLKQISHLTGFHYLNNFIRAFKRKFGVPPGEWRKAMKSILIITGHLSLFPFETVSLLIA